MEQTWRWFGPADPVSLRDIRQAGATGVVTALHQVPIGDVWEKDDIKKRKQEIEAAGLTWSVVESVPVHEAIKRGDTEAAHLINNYKHTIKHLGAAGIRTICYNFMPILDWTRTDLNFRVDDGSEALRFDAVAFAAFDLYILKRAGAEKEYHRDFIKEVDRYFGNMTSVSKKELTSTILAGLPGSFEGFSLDNFRRALERYHTIDEQQLRNNLYHFLAEIIPVAEKAGVRMAIHPDDPPRPILGLPRVVSTEADLVQLLSVNHSSSNGLTLCTGSLGVRADNDLSGIMNRLGNRVNFLHLRSVQREPSLPHQSLETFHEANHLEGHAGMVQVVQAVVQEEQRRKKMGRTDANIPMRPDHGHRMLDDLNKKVNPGYSAIGRLRGLAELRGLELGLLSK